MLSLYLQISSVHPEIKSFSLIITSPASILIISHSNIIHSSLHPTLITKTKLASVMYLPRILFVIIIIYFASPVV